MDKFTEKYLVEDYIVEKLWSKAGHSSRQP